MAINKAPTEVSTRSEREIWIKDLLIPLLCAPPRMQTAENIQMAVGRWMRMTFEFCNNNLCEWLLPLMNR